MTRRLTAEEEALWRQATTGVRQDRVWADADPTRRRAPSPLSPAASPPPSPPAPARAARPPARGETLDRRWDRRLASGRARPDRVIDLHGLTRPVARDRLFQAISTAAARGERLLLVITGRGSEPGPDPYARMTDERIRGAIRAELPHWLAEPAISARIAAVRKAGPRFGGSGAVWLVLRRPRPR